MFGLDFVFADIQPIGFVWAWPGMEQKKEWKKEKKEEAKEEYIHKLLGPKEGEEPKGMFMEHPISCFMFDRVVDVYVESMHQTKTVEKIIDMYEWLFEDNGYEAKD